MTSERSIGMETGVGIVLSAYDPRWVAEYRRVQEELASLLPPTILSINHVGSTSVPGLAAKPIIDILVGVPDLIGSLEFRPALEGAGFMFRADDGLPDRHYFPRTIDGLRSHHVSIAQPDSRHYRNTIVFRDALRADPGLAVRYAALKTELALSVGSDRLAYLNGKTDFMLGVLAASGGEVGGTYPVKDLGRNAG